MSNCSNDSCFKTYTDPLEIAAENNNNYTIRYNTGNRGVPRGGVGGVTPPQSLEILFFLLDGLWTFLKSFRNILQNF